MTALWQDVRYGARMLRKNHGFTFIAVVALALGIGANTAIFSVVNAVLLEPLPFAAPERLMRIKATNLKAKGEGEFGGVSPADFVDWSRQQQSFEKFAAYTGGAVTLTGGSQPEWLTGSRVSREFLDVFGVRPRLGRAFTPEEFKSGGAKAILLSDEAWRRHFGGDPATVGRNLSLGGVPATVIGVMPPDLGEPFEVDVLSPLPEDSSELQLRGNRYFPVVGRLKPGVAPEQAEAEMRTLAQRLEAQHPESNLNWSARVVPLKESLVGHVRLSLLVLLGAVGFVLAVACANVANLMLARGAARRREIAIRAALGASRWRVVRQLLIESVLLAFAGGAVGLLLAWWGVDALKALIPEAMRFPRLDEVGIDGRVLLFTVGVTLVTGVLFGLAPGLQAARPDLQESLKENSRGASGGLRLRRARAALVVSQVALTLLLLVGAGLLARSFVKLQSTDPGFDPENLITFTVAPPRKIKPLTPESANFFAQVSGRIASVAGVAGVATTSGAPLSGFDLVFPFSIEDAAATTSADTPQVGYSAVSPNYFRVMNIPLRAGREFTEHEGKNTPRVCLINETMARRFFPGGDALGKRIKIDYLSAPVAFEIVGVAADVKQNKLDEAPGVGIYVSDLQQPWFSTAVVVRTRANPEGATRAIKEAVWSLNPDQPLTIERADELLGNAVAEPRLYTALLSVFACAALLLAAVGLYGVISYTVAQRTHEIGVRIALGASGGDVLRLIVKQGMLWTFAGIALGALAAWWLSGVLAKMLYEVRATDPTTFIGVAVLLSAVAFVASYIPARRAMKVDPMIALRHE